MNSVEQRRADVVRYRLTDHPLTIVIVPAILSLVAAFAGVWLSSAMQDRSARKNRKLEIIGQYWARDFTFMQLRQREFESALVHHALKERIRLTNAGPSHKSVEERDRWARINHEVQMRLMDTRERHVEALGLVRGYFGGDSRLRALTEAIAGAGLGFGEFPTFASVEEIDPWLKEAVADSHERVRQAYAVPGQALVEELLARVAD